MKQIDSLVLIEHGFKSTKDGIYIKELISPENNEASCEISVWFNGNEWKASVKNYFGINKWYSGTDYFSNKSMRRLINALKKNLSFYGF